MRPTSHVDGSGLPAVRSAGTALRGKVHTFIASDDHSKTNVPGAALIALGVGQASNRLGAHPQRGPAQAAGKRESLAAGKYSVAQSKPIPFLSKKGPHSSTAVALSRHCALAPKWRLRERAGASRYANYARTSPRYRWPNVCVMGGPAEGRLGRTRAGAGEPTH